MTNRELIIDFAKSLVGVKESPKGSNKVIFNEWYGNGAIKGKWAWCGTFISYVYYFAGCALEKIDTIEGFHYVPSAQNHFRRTKQNVLKPNQGDIIFYDFNGGLPDHCGIFYKWVTKDKFLAIEGNTSPDEKGSQSNGGQVCIKLRHIKSVTSFASPDVLNP